MTGFICHDDYYDRTKRLTDEELGHLFRQLMLYHAGRHDEIEEFVGAEGIAFDFIKDDIDRMENKSDTNRENGSKGGRPRNRTKPNETEQNPTKAKETEPNPTKAYKDKDKDKDKDIDKYNKSSSSLSPSSFLGDDEAHKTQEEQNQVLNAAENAGFQMSNSVRARLIALYADSGLVKLLEGINSCVKHGATNLAYLEAVLRGAPKKPKPKVNAQDYDQRDYDQVTDELMQEQIRDMEAWMQRSG